MPSNSRSDSDADHGRGRSATFSVRAGRRASQNLSRNEWYGKSLAARCNTSPVGLVPERRTSPLLKSKKVGYHASLNVAHTAGTTLWPASSKGSDTAVTDESGSATSPSGGADDGSDVPTPRWTRRRVRKGKEDKRSPKSQQRLVSVIIVLVVILASLQIFALVVHTPRDGGRDTKSLLAGDDVAAVSGAENGFHRRAVGVRNSLLRGEEEGNVNHDGDMTATAGFGGERTVPRGGLNQHQGLSISNPRAFEMVAADMGHLRDTIEKLENILKERMGKQGNDIYLVMRRLGLQPQRGNPAVQAAVDPTERFVPKPFSGDPNDYKDGKHVPTEVKWKQQLQQPNEQSSSAETAIWPSVEDLESVPKELPRESPGRQSFDVNSSREERVGGDIGATRNDDYGWNPHTRGKWVNGQWVPKVFVDMSPPDISRLVDKQRRVLLLSERRSGAGTVGRVLNADPHVFYVRDPCRMGGGPEALFGDACSKMVSRLLACQPTINDVRNMYSFSYIVEKSRALSQFERYRVEGGGSPEESDELIRVSLVQLCNRSEVVMVKETRIADMVPRVSMPELSAEFLLVVRDPRATLHGLSQSWGRSNNEFDRAMSKNCTDLAVKICSSTEKKLEGLIGLGKDRFRVLKYEMVTAAPFAMTKSVYAWLDLGDLPEEVLEEIMNVSAQVVVPPPPGGAAQVELRTTLAQFDWATRWASEMPDFRRHQIQRVCKPLLASLGYEEAVGIGQRSDEVVGGGTAAADGVSSSDESGDDSSGARDARHDSVPVAAKVTAATSTTAPAVPAANIAEDR